MRKRTAAASRCCHEADGVAPKSCQGSRGFDRLHPTANRAETRPHGPRSTSRFVYHAAGLANLGTSSYIDSVVLRDRDQGVAWSAPGVGLLDERRYYCQNWRGDVVALTKSTGVPLECVRYSSYGEPTVYPVADLNMDGAVTSTDQTIWNQLAAGTASASAYTRDIDFDGTYAANGSDAGLFSESYAANSGKSGKGKVSTDAVANRVGYAAYQWDPTIAAFHVRCRVYKPEIGRWTRRDPLGYLDGLSLYQYVNSRTMAMVDPFGMSGSLNPAALPGWLQVIIANLTNQGLTAAQIAVRLAALGVSPFLIAEALDLTDQKAIEFWLLSQFEDVYGELANIYGGASRLLKYGGCRAANAMFMLYCKNGDVGKSCDKFEAKRCELYRTEGYKHSACAIARLAIITAKCPPYHDNVEAFMNSVKAAVNCFRRYQECTAARDACADGNGSGGDPPKAFQ